MHKRSERVSKAVRLGKSQMRKEFQKIRREGIIEYNREEAKKDNPSYQGERKRSKYTELLACSNCSAFISRRFFANHKKNCSKQNDAPAFGVPLYLDQFTKNKKLSQNFIENVLSKMRNDELGTIVRGDDHIVYLGNKFFKLNEHKGDKLPGVCRKVRSEMRSLASLYSSFKDSESCHQIHHNLLDIFQRENFDVLCEAIDDVTYDEDQMLKPGARVNLYYLLLKSIKSMRDRMFLEKNDVCYAELNAFYTYFKSNEETVRSARYSLANTKLKKTRRPSHLPLDEDIIQIHQHILSEIKRIDHNFEYWCPSSFIELRNIVMTRLTLLNGRRGGEVARLLVKDWMDAEQDGWIDQEKLKALPAGEQILAKAMKIVYITGKGNHHLVSLLVPNDTVSALNWLADSNVRKLSNVQEANMFVFASTQKSRENFSGWHALKNVCGNINGLKRPERINATNNRHRVSTIYAGLDIPEKDRELFYTHMGHSKDVNHNVYQCPLSLMGLTRLGPKLMEMNSMYIYIDFPSLVH